MDEKKLLKDIATDVSEMKFQMVTQDDLDQRLQDQTEKIMSEFSTASDERAEIRTTLDRLNTRNNEEVIDIYNRIEFLEKQVSKLQHTSS